SSVHSTYSAFAVLGAGTEIFAAQFPDLPRELVASAVDARLDRAFRQPQLDGDFVIRELLDVAHQDGGAQRLRQRAQRLFQQMHAIALLHHRYLALRLADGHQLRRVDVAIDGLALLPDAAIVIDAEIAAHADEPRLEIRPTVERRERFEDLEEDVLRQIFRFVVPADELVRHVEHLAAVLADDRIPGELIAFEAALD